MHVDITVLYTSVSNLLILVSTKLEATVVVVVNVVNVNVLKAGKGF